MVWLIVGWVLFAVAVILLFIVLTAIFIYRHFFNRRCDGNPHVTYFTAKDFDGLQAEPISFVSGKNILRGFIYRRNLPMQGLIIFAHGYGAGHLAYTTEIDAFTRAGFCVLAYDGTGCGSSEGKNMRGFDQGPLDLLAAIRFARSDAQLCQLPVALAGHSWGAFSVLNVSPLCGEYRVCGAVAMGGFISSASVLAQSAASHVKLLKPFRLPLEFCFWLFNRIRFQAEANFHCIRSLQKTDIPVLLLYGKKDKTVLFRHNGEKIGRSMQGSKNIVYRAYPEKSHNVYLTAHAEAAMEAQFTEAFKMAKNDPDHAGKYYAAIDYHAVTEEDPAVMAEMICFLKNCLA